MDWLERSHNNDEYDFNKQSSKCDQSIANDGESSSTDSSSTYIIVLHKM